MDLTSDPMDNISNSSIADRIMRLDSTRMLREVTMGMSSLSDANWLISRAPPAGYGGQPMYIRQGRPGGGGAAAGAAGGGLLGGSIGSA